MPIVETILTRALGDLTMSTLSMVFSSATEYDDRVQLWSVMLQNNFGEVVGILTNDQAEDIAKFLDSVEVRSTFQAQFLGRLAEADNQDTSDFSDRLIQMFSRLAERWCATSGQDWSSLAPEIWDRIVHTMTSLFPADEILSALTPDEIELFREQMEVDAQTSRVRKGVPRFLRDLLDMSTNLERVVTTRDTVTDLRRLLKEYYAQIRLDHAQHDFRIQIDQLYIDRDLVRSGTAERLKSTDIFMSPRRVRIVVTGDPGIGKSTFTEYMIRQLSEKPSDGIAPLVINCKEFGVGGERSLISMLKIKIENSLQLTVSEHDLEDILTVGWGLVIVDGVDEILDLSLRRRFIRAVEALAKRFPLCSIVATSRNVGYSQAQFAENRFARFELHSFTDDEIKEYARRWFSLVGRPESHIDRFLVELDSIPDLRGNPLLLSLLCVLYRARGYIPRNRRQIYSQCADLLFHRWDPMREIEQPYDHQHYGDELMQEIARWFYKSQAAQAGVEEQQLKHVIASFLRDTASVPASEADRRAAAFLDFCADRAWLLGVAGPTERGQRLFVFTHRTFMEFFAAESLARTLEIDDLITEVADIYNKDASSVLPDLIVQSAEVHRRSGARQIITGLLERGGGLGRRQVDRFLPLCLRIVNLSPVYPSLMDKIFEKTISNWAENTPTESHASTICVLELYRDPRNRFMDHLRSDISCISNGICEAGHAHPLVDFLIRWAHVYMNDMTAPFEEEWHEFVNEMVVVTLPHLHTVREDTLAQFLIDNGYSSPAPDLASGLIARAFNNTVVGYTFRSVERMLWDITRPHDMQVVEALGELARSGEIVDSRIGYALDRSLKVRSSRFPFQWSGPSSGSSHSADLRDIAVWLGCIIFEASANMNPFHDVISSWLGLDWYRIIATRGHYLDLNGEARQDEDEDDYDEDEDDYDEDDEYDEDEDGLHEDRQDETSTYRVDLLSEEELDLLATDYTPWLKSWSLGEWNLVEESDEEEEEQE